VGAVEVSLDGGKTWHPAKGRENWSYQATFGFSGSLERVEPGRGRQRQSRNSGTRDYTYGRIAELPVHDLAERDRAGNRRCRIFPAAGTRRAIPLRRPMVTSQECGFTRAPPTPAPTSAICGVTPACCWPALLLRTRRLLAGSRSTSRIPVPITANNLFVASYQTSVGHFSLDQGYFTTFGVENPPLNASADTSGHANEFVHIQRQPGIPANTLNASNYWVDAVFNYKPTPGSPLSVRTAFLPNGTQSVEYHQRLAAAGGDTPYHWSLISGALPTGLTLSASGNITGTPTASGTRSFTVRVADSSKPSQTATQP